MFGCSFVQAQEELSLSAEAFSTMTEISHVRISPNGKRLFMYRRVDEQGMFITRSLVDLEAPLNAVPINRSWSGQVHWANDDTIILNIGGWKKMDWEGNELIDLKGRLINNIPDDPDHILMKYNDRINKVNIHTLEEEFQYLGPISGHTFYADKNNIVRFAVNNARPILSNRKGTMGYYKHSFESDWQKIYEEVAKLGTGRKEEGFGKDLLQFASFTDDPNVIYVYLLDENEKISLYTYDVENRTRIDKIISHEKYDITRVDFDENYNLEVYYFDGEYPQRIWLSEFGKRIQKIFDKNFPDSYVFVDSYSTDKNKMILRVVSPHDPGTFYLLDLKNSALEMVGYKYEKLDTTKLSDVTPVIYKARDGLEIPGFLTIPAGSDGKNLPFIVVPHDGPIARDYWGFNSRIQFLASLGYGVLQMNYRGSTGYGFDFQYAGFHEWGRKILFDINDGAKWLVEQGIADPERICIFGQGYGGYAALQANVEDSSLYKCAIASEPIIDMEEFLDRVDTNYIENREIDVEDISPYHTYKNIKNPILLFTGYKKDRNYIPAISIFRYKRSSYGERVKKFVDNVEEAGLDIKLVEYEDYKREEGSTENNDDEALEDPIENEEQDEITDINHILYDRYLVKNRVLFLTEMGNFLAKHLKE